MPKSRKPSSSSSRKPLHKRKPSDDGYVKKSKPKSSDGPKRQKGDVTPPRKSKDTTILSRVDPNKKPERTPKPKSPPPPASGRNTRAKKKVDPFSETSENTVGSKKTEQPDSTKPALTSREELREEKSREARAATEPVRLHRFLAQCGIASRRKAEEIIAEGRITINGELITEQGVKVNPGDVVMMDEKQVSPPDPRLYLLNKPIGIVTTMDDDRGRRAIADLIPSSAQGIKPVGRLDMNTTGLIFLTNDGDLAHRLSHPRYGIEKEYIATVQGVPSDKLLQRLSRGITIDGEKTAESKWEFIGTVKNENQARLRIILHEGRNRQIRKMVESVGHPVITLRRVRIGNYTIKGMEEGELRLIGKKDHDALRKKLGL